MCHRTESRYASAMRRGETGGSVRTKCYTAQPSRSDTIRRTHGNPLKRALRIGDRVVTEDGDGGVIDAIGTERLRAFRVYWFGLGRCTWVAQSHVIRTRDWSPANPLRDPAGIGSDCGWLSLILTTGNRGPSAREEVRQACGSCGTEEEEPRRTSPHRAQRGCVDTGTVGNRPRGDARGAHSGRSCGRRGSVTTRRTARAREGHRSRPLDLLNRSAGDPTGGGSKNESVPDVM